MKKIIPLLIGIMLIAQVYGVALAQEDYLEEEDVSQIAVKKASVLNHLVISGDNAEIKTIAKYLDAEDNEIGERKGKTFRYWDIEDDENTPEVDESCDDFTVFMQKLGLNRAIIEQAVIEMETE